jgi:hypothetical protein
VNDKVGDRFKANNRVADATLSWAGGSRKVHFEDRAALQSFDLPKVSTPFIRLTINSVYKGNRFADTSISEVVIYGHPAAGTAPSAPTGGIATPAWVICVAAYDGKEQAEARAKKLREIGGFPAGVLWIPDYASLSGAKKWLAYAGPVPYGDRPAAESLLSKVKGWGIDAYAIKVDTSPGREEFR